MRFFYTVLYYLALPFVLIRLWYRSLRQPAYRQRLCERFGYTPCTFEKSLWIHAVSVGEVLAAVPLIKALHTHYPQLPFLVTTTTPTGAECVVKALGDTVTHAYLPYDLPFAIRCFLRRINPVACIIMETELWPNLLAVSQNRGLPVCLVNARLSEKSASGYRRIAWLTRRMLNQLDLIAAHGQVDANRFAALGASRERLVVTGSIKFDLDLPPNIMEQGVMMRHTLGKKRFVWIAASTHEDEESILLAAHQQVRIVDPDALLLLVPRHPHRFDAVATLAGGRFVTVRHSQQQPSCMQQAAVYVGDTMGELLLMYAAADVAFVGGSLVPRGGHNILEPAALGKAILSGPHVFNFAEISESFAQVDALAIVSDATEIAEKLIHLMRHPDERRRMGVNALKVMVNNRGALNRQVTLLRRVIQSGCLRH